MFNERVGKLHCRQQVLGELSTKDKTICKPMICINHYVAYDGSLFLLAINPSAQRLYLFDVVVYINP